ncbi:MAG: trypco2 family protein [Candidatus Electrothrix sp. GW3-4]|uniref:trypco2 family protein n=1 Tax=Candidatus Electrothrix sp. GW3-4 TaxID=3126740 RepID=UPI0030CF3AB5
MSEEEQGRLELAEMIKGLRAQLAEAQREGEDKDIRFTVEDVELELQITTEGQAKGGVAAKFYVLTSKVDVSKKDTVTQKLKLKLKAEKADGGSVQVSDHGQRPD